ncbi:MULTISPECIES: DNA polymerase III subunit gamma and tau [unclassified Leifsonia]|uniref:DNA polymerase III subunit gamma and tau n=1 Tax=unclassified Leifsonia TaxID=2663824 RepID=UPI0006F66A8A|nr:MULTISPECIES: DNA polymerase III subunit gamma and tau [unclassified Leifsonia]KQX05640.1 DNA polymerase III subunit gamma/tau [Leifsonia sp. Root1293]KRA09275.1 DNA polymerase III subunit gamma/tau [Leifsonia sp. Root60]
MVTALYRRYRPETFSEMIGQSQVTDPLMTALRADRVNHAYLFSGPRGCGKTTSARILARCLNCAEGPTDTPCGKCDSCVELSRAGGGSLDVVEIDAASHNGVDDARDLRERAIFAPARDRYKIFILDEAHMVTPQGFNALLKLVEEPPEHVKFIFATTEPEKVLGTIRSRTHHYPFRLVPPAQMLEYVQKLCDEEGVKVAPGVLPLVVRAGGGSPRDTLSLLDQLMAGSEDSTVDYERAVALLGFTHGALLDEIIDAIAARDAAGAFAGIDRVIQTGQDPRRFVEDLLERLRDLIVVGATTAKGAAAVLRGVPQDELDRMGVQATAFGQAELSRTADIVNAALTEMTGATSPRLHLELLVARALVPAADDTERGALARVERLERRVGVTDAAPTAAPAAPAAPSVAPAAAPAAPAPAPRAVPAATSAAAPAAPTAAPSAGPESDAVAPAPAPRVAATPPAAPAAAAPSDPATEAAATTAAAVRTTPVGPVTFAQVKDAWPEVLEAVKAASLNAWMVVFTAQVRELRDDDVLVLGFPSQKDVAALKQQAAPGQGVGDHLKRAVSDILGFTPKLIARVESPGGSGGSGPTEGSTPTAGGPGGASAGAGSAAAAPASAPQAPAAQKATRATSSAATSAPAPATPADSADGWATITIPGAGSAPAARPAPAPASVPATPGRPDSSSEAPAEPSAAPTPSTPSAESAPSAPADEEPPFNDVPPPFDDEPPYDPGLPDDPGPRYDARPAAAPRQQTAPAPARGQRPAAPGQRYGESVVREVLGATFLEEQPHTPKTGFRERA